MAIHSSILACRIPMDRETWQATVQGVTKSQTQLKDWAHIDSGIQKVLFLLDSKTTKPAILTLALISINDLRFQDLSFSRYDRKNSVHPIKFL